MDDAATGETIIYLDRPTIIGRMILGVIMAAALSYPVAVLDHDYSIGYILMVAFAVFFYFTAFKGIYRLITHKPQIIINTMGVQIPPAKPDNWDEIGNVKFEKVREGRTTKIMLSYTVLAKEGSSVRREINIADFDINNKIQMTELLNRYRLQFYVHTKREMIPLPGLNDPEE